MIKKMKKKNFYVLISAMIILISCEKTPEPSQIYYDTSTLRGYRGDTISLQTSNLNPENAIVIISNYYYDTIREIECEIIPASADKIKFIIPDELLYFNDEISSVLLGGEESFSLEIYNGSDVILQAGLMVLFDPLITTLNMPSKIKCSDTISITGRDLDMKTMFIEFNSIKSTVLYQTSRKLNILVPDSCGHGDLHIRCESNWWSKDKVLAEQEYELDFIPNYKTPKKVISTWNNKQFFDYDMQFNSDNRIISCDLFNAVGDQHKRRTTKYEYNNYQQLVCVKSFYDNEISHVDSFKYIDTRIIETIYTKQQVDVPSGNPEIPPYTVDSLMPYGKIEYILDNNDRIVSSKHSYVSEETNSWEITEIREFDFISNKKCNFKITEINTYLDNGIETTKEWEYEYILTYNSRNHKVPLQMKTYMNGLYLIMPNDLDYAFFPGSMIYKQNSSTATDVDLYYDEGGNLVKEEYYYIPFGGEKELIRSSKWIY